MSFGRVVGPVAQQRLPAGTSVVPLSSAAGTGLAVNVVDNSFTIADITTAYQVMVDLDLVASKFDFPITVQLWNLTTLAIMDQYEYRASSGSVQESTFPFIFQPTNAAHEYQIRIIVPNTAPSGNALTVDAGPIFMPCVTLTIQQFTDPGGGGGVLWNTIGDPAANQTLNMLAFTTNWTYSTAVVNALNLDVVGDAAKRFTLRPDGSQYFGDGVGAQDVAWYRRESNALAMGNNLGISDANRGMEFRMGSAPTAWSAAAATDGADMYLATQGGGAGVQRGGDFIFTPGAGAGGARDGLFKINGKLTVTGLIDPLAVILSDPAAGTSLYYESFPGQTAPVSGATTGRIRYNNVTATWQISVQGGAYASIITTATGWLQGGNAFGALGVFGTTDAFDVKMMRSSVEKMRMTTAGVTFGSGTTTTCVIPDVPALTGADNTLIGTSAGAALTTGDRNTFVGTGAGISQTTASSNTVVGWAAGAAITTESFNTLVGSSAGNVLTAVQCTMIGNSAGALTTTGINNTFLGGSAGRTVTTGSQNVMIGFDSGESAGGAVIQNVFVGETSGRFATGSQNVFVGYQAGSDAGNTASGNVFVGNMAGAANATGALNTFVGDNAGLVNTTGQHNTFLGGAAGDANTTADDNTFVGYFAGLVNTTGVQNTFVGSGTGQTMTTGSNNAFIGFGADGDPTGSGQIALGSGATCTISNQMVIGSTAAFITDAYIGNGVTNAAPQDVAVHATGGLGAAVPGASMRLAGGVSGDAATAGNGLYLSIPLAGTATVLTDIVYLQSSGGETIISNTPASFFPIKPFVGLSVVSDGSLGLGGVVGTWSASDTDYAATFSGVRSRGTPAAPTPVVNGDQIAAFAGLGYGSDSLIDASVSAGILMSVDGTPGAAYVPARIDFLTKVDGGGGLAIRMTIRNDGFVGVAQTAAFGTEIFGVTGDVYIDGKLTVTGAIDPVSVLLSDPAAGTELFFESLDGSTAPVSAVNSGRIRYNDVTAKWQVSIQGNAYVDISTGGGGTSWDQGGNAFAALGVFGTTDAFDVKMIRGGVEKMRMKTTGVTFGSGATTTCVIPDVTALTGADNTFVGSGSGAAATSGTQNTFVGRSAGAATTTASDNTFIGRNAGTANIVGASNTCVGSNAGASATSSFNVFVGKEAGSSVTTAAENTFVGFATGVNVTTAERNTFVGGRAGNTNTGGADNTYLGYFAGKAADANRNTFVGSMAGATGVTTGDDNVFMGYSAGVNNTGGAQSTFLGSNAGAANTVSGDNTYIGFQAGTLNDGAQNTFIGASAGAVATTATENTLVGYNTASSMTTSQGNTCVGWQAGKPITTGNFNTFVGYDPGPVAALTGDYNIGIGAFIAGAMTSGTENILIGHSSGAALTTDSENVFIGHNAGTAQSSVDGNVFIGGSAGAVNGTGASNVFVGFNAGAVSDASSNTFLGHSAGVLATSGASNAFVGNSAGATITTGSNNTFLGTTADGVAASSGQIAIGSGAVTTASNQLVVGSTAAFITDAYLGNGVTNAAPQAFKLHATGGLGAGVAGAALTLAAGISGDAATAGGNVNVAVALAGTGTVLTNVLVVSAAAGGTVTVTGKLTVTGAIDPTSVLLSGGTALYYESNDGVTAPVSGAATGRIRYNNTTGTWQVSTQGGAYASLTSGGVAGAGTANRMTKWTAAAVVGDGPLDSNAGNTVVNPTADAAVSLGTSSLRFTTLAMSSTVSIFAVSADANPTSQLLSASLTMGAGGGTAVDVRMRRTAANTFTFDNGGAGAATLVPATDSQNNLGTATLRWSQVNANTHSVYAASADANPSAQMSTTKIQFGPGGATAMDTRIARTAAATLTIDDGAGGAVTILPGADNVGAIGSNAQRWSLVRATTITSGRHVFQDEQTRQDVWAMHEDADALYVQSLVSGQDIAKFDRDGNLYIKGEVRQWK